MKTPGKYRLSSLSRKLYVEFLQKSQARGFSFVRFQDFLPGQPANPSRFILLRHDIDFAPRYSLEMAELEHELGVASTYFVLVDGHFYNPLQKDVIDQIRGIRFLGHEIGLHFSVSSAADPDIGKEVAFRLDLLSAIAGVRVCSFSQHDPVNAGFASIDLPAGYHACVDASRVIRDHNLLYVSDSAMMWRRHTFETALDEDRNLCLLAHPQSWLHPQDDYVAMIREFESIEAGAVSARYDAFVEALSGYYERRLKEGV